jgi:hypothetical protein
MYNRIGTKKFMSVFKNYLDENNCLLFKSIRHKYDCILIDVENNTILLRIQSQDKLYTYIAKKVHRYFFNLNNFYFYGEFKANLLFKIGINYRGRIINMGGTNISAIIKLKNKYLLNRYWDNFYLKIKNIDDERSDISGYTNEYELNNNIDNNDYYGQFDNNLFI